jgi:hypothetical protein
MRALLASELRRFFLRPLVRAFAAAVAVAIVVTAVAVLMTSHKDTQEHIRLLEASHEQAITKCVEAGFNPPLSSIPADDRREFCATEGLSGPPFTFHLTQLLDIVEGAGFKGTAIPLVIVSFLLGASFAGAEWQAGAMTTLLGWEPRRLRVLVAKIAVPAASLFVGVTGAQALLGTALVPAALFKGTTQGTGGSWLVSLTGAAIRVAILAAIAAGLGACLAMIGRGTAAALGVAAIYALGELLVRGFEDPEWQRWLLGENAGIFVMARTPAGGGGFSPSGALLVVMLVAAAAILLAARSFLHRDIA